MSLSMCFAVFFIQEILSSKGTIIRISLTKELHDCCTMHFSNSQCLHDCIFPLQQRTIIYRITCFKKMEKTLKKLYENHHSYLLIHRKSEA